MKLSTAATGLCLAGWLATALLAHDLYVWPETFRLKAGEILVVALNHGDLYPESAGVAPLARLGETKLIGAGGTIELKDFTESHNALVKSVKLDNTMTGSLVLTAMLKANMREHDAKEFAKYIEDERLEMVAQYRRDHAEQDKPAKEIYSKYAKALVVNGAPSAFSTRPVGLKIEVVPGVDLATLKPGESLPIQVLFGGKPAAGLVIETAWTTGGLGESATVGRTDSRGRLLVPLQRGKCRITTAMSERYADQTVANWETFLATLVFEVGR